MMTRRIILFVVLITMVGGIKSKAQTVLAVTPIDGQTEYIDITTASSIKFCRDSLAVYPRIGNDATMNYSISDVRKLYFTEAVATPLFSLASGTYIGAQEVIIRCATEGATIYYTLNGSEPINEYGAIQGFAYSSPITIWESTTVKAVAIKTGMKNSEVATALYNIEFETVATPIFLPIAGTYTEAIDVTINCVTEGATIYFTLDGSEPISENGIIQGYVYASPITIDENTEVKAVAVKTGMQNSEVETAIYNIETNITNLCDFDCQQFSISPNPVGDYVMIEGVKDDMPFVIYTINGIEVLRSFIYNGECVNVSSLSPGNYLLIIGNWVGRFIKM